MKKFTNFLLACLIVFSPALLAQKPAIELTLTAEYNNQYVLLDSIYVENLTQGGDTMLFYPDTVMILDYIIGINNPAFKEDGFRVLQNRPNPFREQTEISFFMPEAGEMDVTVSNVVAQKIVSFEKNLTAGRHTFVFYPGSEHCYILSATFRGTTRAIKMVTMNPRSRKTCELLFVGSEEIPQEFKSTQGAKGFPFTLGDQLRFIGYSKSPLGFIASDVIEVAPDGDEDYIFAIIEGIPCTETPTVTYEGFIYTTVQIGTQCWFKENLNVGTMINSGTNQSNNGTIEKFCYDDDPANCEIYGGLYQWDEMMQYTTQQGAQGICPPTGGWHLPKDSEITALTDYLGGEEVACGKMKETGTWHWSDPNTGATNSSGFTAFAGGYYDPDMGFGWPSLTFYGSYWSSTESDADNAWERDLGYEDEYLWRIEFLKTAGLSARCMKNQLNVPAVTTAGITDISQTSAMGGGEVTDDGGSEVTVRGVCWSTSQNPTIADNHTLDGTGTGIFVSYLTGLSPNTPYFVRAFATNVAGTAYGNEVTFSTLPGITIPAVSTSGITDITQTTATSGGEVTDDGGSEVTARGVCWSTSQNPTIADNHTLDGTGTGIFVSYLTGLTTNTPYYVRAYATNSVGTTYGNEETFTTLPAAFTCGNVVNYEGQNYNTIQIGTQCWFKENLNVGTMVNGSQNQTNNGTIEKYCYSNAASNCTTYGGLYQWDEMMQYSTTPGIQGICPADWHLPTQAEWNTLITFLGGTGVAGGKMKETGTVHWNPPNSGATNSSGFTAFGGGGLAAGSFFSLKDEAYLWSSSLYNTSRGYSVVLYTWDPEASMDNFQKGNGNSVRCLKN